MNVKFSNIANLFYTKPTDANLTPFAYKEMDGTRKNGSQVTLTAGKTTRTVVFDPERKHFQILQPTNFKQDQRFILVDGERTAFESRPVQATLRLGGWKEIKAELADDDAVKAFATTVLEQTINYKAVRFVRWSALSITDLVSQGYNSPKVCLATKCALATSAVCLGILLWNKASCQINYQSTSETQAKEMNRFVSFVLSLRGYFGR